MKVTSGQTLKKFARLIEVSDSEAVDFVNSYVNHPEDFHNPELIEKTEAQRLESIKAYITMRIDESSNERIRMANAARKQEAA